MTAAQTVFANLLILVMLVNASAMLLMLVKIVLYVVLDSSLPLSLAATKAHAATAALAMVLAPAKLVTLELDVKVAKLVTGARTATKCVLVVLPRPATTRALVSAQLESAPALEVTVVPTATSPALLAPTAFPALEMDTATLLPNVFVTPTIRTATGKAHTVNNASTTTAVINARSNVPL